MIRKRINSMSSSGVCNLLASSSVGHFRPSPPAFALHDANVLLDMTGKRFELRLIYLAFLPALSGAGLAQLRLHCCGRHTSSSESEGISGSGTITFRDLLLGRLKIRPHFPGLQLLSLKISQHQQCLPQLKSRR